MDARVRHQVGLEFSDIDVEGTIEAERCGLGRDDLSNQSVQVGVGRALNVQGAAADVTDGLVIKEDDQLSVLEKGMGGEHTVVRLDHCGGYLRSRIDAVTKLRLFAVVDGQALEEEGSETRTGTTTNGIEDKETLQTSAVVSQLADTVEGVIDSFLANGVVTTGVVVGGIFLTSDQLFRVVQLAVGASADFVDDGRLQVEEDGARDVHAFTSLGKKSVEGIIAAANGLVGRLGDNITAVHHAAGHVLAVARVALGHHGGEVKDRVGDLGHGELLVVGLLSRDDGSVQVGAVFDFGVNSPHQIFFILISDEDTVDCLIITDCGLRMGSGCPLPWRRSHRFFLDLDLLFDAYLGRRFTLGDAFPRRHPVHKAYVQ